MNDLVLIPARGGSKGIPGKNIKPLEGRPLIYYTLDAACDITESKNVCVSTDADDIIEKVIKYGLEVPFKRPAELATDSAGSNDVILHAIDFYEKNIFQIDRVILLQPTSPFRTGMHIKEALALYQDELDMVVSVKVTKANPYYSLFEENKFGFLTPSKPEQFKCRQDCPPVYELNGAIYIINVRSLKNGPISQFTRIRKYVMSEENSIDVDTNFDWFIAKAVASRNLKRKQP